jgi:hypothetical protein
MISPPDLKSATRIYYSPDRDGGGHGGPPPSYSLPNRRTKS